MPETTHLAQPDVTFSDGIYFRLQEFACPLSGEIKIHARLLFALDYCRGQLDAPILVTSGYRSLAHNRAVGGARNSQHLLGRAADVQPQAPNVKNMLQLWRLLRAEEHVRGLGFYWSSEPAGRFIHADVRDPEDGPPPAVWIECAGYNLRNLNDRRAAVARGALPVDVHRLARSIHPTWKW